MFTEYRSMGPNHLRVNVHLTTSRVWLCDCVCVSCTRLRKRLV